MFQTTLLRLLMTYEFRWPSFVLYSPSELCRVLARVMGTLTFILGWIDSWRYRNCWYNFCLLPINRDFTYLISNANGTPVVWVYCPTFVHVFRTSCVQNSWTACYSYNFKHTQHSTFPKWGLGEGGRGIFFAHRLHCLKIFRHTKKFCGCTIFVSFNADVLYDKCRDVYVWSVFLPNSTYFTGWPVNAIKWKRYLCIDFSVAIWLQETESIFVSR